MLLLLGIGFWSDRRQTAGYGSFAAANRGMGGFVSAISAAASSESAWVMLSLSGLGWKHGLGAYWASAGCAAGFVFVSSPNAVTPFHIDPEHNFLLQLRGSKTMNVFDPFDREVIAEEHIENTYYGEHMHRNLVYKDEFKSREDSVVLQPGDAIHVPIHAPHWVQNGPEVSISFSITFRSDQSQKNVRIHSMNGRLRNMGMKPKGLGVSAFSDNSKDMLLRTLISAKNVLKKQA